MKNTFMVGDDKKAKKWINIFETSLNLLSAASKKKPEEFNYAFDIMTREHIHFESNLHLNYKKINNLIEEKIPIREKYMRLMNAYEDLYEGYYKCVVSIFAISKIILNNKKVPEDIEVFIHDDPSIKIKELNEDDKGECVEPFTDLCEGCNRNLRNGICHKHWKIEGNNITIWDWNKIEKREVWRKTYNIQQLKNEIDNLQDTAEAMMLAVMLRTLSLHKNKNGLLSIAPANYDFDYLKDMMEHAAMDFGLFLNDCEVSESNNTMIMVLCVPRNLHLEQVEKIMEGSKPPRIYKVPVCIIEESVRDMILNFLIVVSGLLLSYSSVTIVVSDEIKGKIGEFKIKSSELSDFMGGGHKYIEQMLNILQPFVVKITREGPSVPDYPWNPVDDGERLANWRNLCNSK
jgi:hypothetical protein